MFFAFAEENVAGKQVSAKNQPATALSLFKTRCPTFKSQVFDYLPTALQKADFLKAKLSSDKCMSTRMHSMADFDMYTDRHDGRKAS
jgi:hypothetical protein